MACYSPGGYGNDTAKTLPRTDGTAMKTHPLRRRLDRLEAKTPAAALPSIAWIVVEPGEHGPVPTGEVIRWEAA